MEQTNTPIATPEQRQALRRNQQQRLRDQAEALLRAVEALEPPQTYAEAEPAAEQAALTTWQAVLDHSLETLAEARRMNRESTP